MRLKRFVQKGVTIHACAFQGCGSGLGHAIMCAYQWSRLSLSLLYYLTWFDDVASNLKKDNLADYVA